MSRDPYRNARLPEEDSALLTNDARRRDVTRSELMRASVDSTYDESVHPHHRGGATSPASTAQIEPAAVDAAELSRWLDDLWGERDAEMDLIRATWDRHAAELSRCLDDLWDQRDELATDSGQLPRTSTP